MINKRFVSTVELAKMLGISRIAVFNKINNGLIKAVKVGRNYVIDQNDLGWILGQELTKQEKRGIDEAVKKTVAEYGQTLKLLGSS